MKLRRPRVKKTVDESESRYYLSRPNTTTLRAWYSVYRDYIDAPSTTQQGMAKWNKDHVAVRDGRGLKGYRERIIQGLDATTYFRGVRDTYDMEPSSVSWKLFKPSGDVFSGRTSGYAGGGYLNAPQAMACSESAADNTARMRFYQSLREAQQSLSGLTFVGEMGELLRQLRNPARAARELLGDYCADLRNWRSRHGKASASKVQRAVSDTWLEYSFGLAPSLDDIKSIAGAMDDLLLEEPSVVVKGRGFDEKRKNTIVYGENPYLEVDVSGYLYLFHRCHEHHKVMVRYIGSVKRAAYGPEDATGYLRRLGMDSFWEFVPTAWQLLPWSFFADMFSNISSVIESSVTSTAGVQWTCKTVRKTLSHEVLSELNASRMDQSYGKNKWLVSSSFFGRGIAKHREIIRTSQGAQVPTLRFEIPGSSAQFLNLAALASSVAKLTPFK